MPSLIIYLIKANIALTLFYLAYRFGLRRLTFYNLNRFYLLFGIAFSSLFPFIHPETFFTSDPQNIPVVFLYSPDWNSIQASLEPVQSMSAWSMVEFVFWTGVVVMAMRLLLQLISLFKFHRTTQPGSISGKKVRLLSDRVNPFSFFKNIYINPELYSADEIENILSHERVHVEGWHSLDVLVSEINQIFYWFNPGVWLMKTAVKENLEFIADHKVLISGRDVKNYQYDLLKLSLGSFPLALTNHFNISHLKMRIKMMNSKKSSGTLLMRYLILIPVVLLTLFIVRSSTAQKESRQKNLSGALTNADTLKVVKKLPPAGYFNQKGYYIMVKESTGNAEVMNKNGIVTGPYSLYSMNQQAIESFNEKFGSTITYEEIQAHKNQVAYLKSHPAITKYSYGSENKILIWTGKTSKIYDISKSYDRNLLIKQYGSIPPRYDWLKLGERRVEFTPPRPVLKDTTIPNKKTDERSTYQFHKAFLNRNQEIEDYRWKSGKDGQPAILFIRLKNGNEERYNMADAKEAEEAENKYGIIPLPPPPMSTKKSATNFPINDPGTHQFYQSFLKQNPAIKNLSWYGAKGSNRFGMNVYLQNGEKEIYDLTRPEDVKKAELKYGELPSPPPPPPGKIPPPPPPPHPVAVAQSGYSPKSYQEFIKRNPLVEKVEGIDFKNGKEKLPEKMIVFLKNGNKEIYSLNNASDMHKAIEKYKMLPAPPPPLEVKGK